MIPLHRKLLRRFADLLALFYKPRAVPHKPHVVHVTPQYFAQDSYIGGGERYPMELARAMAEYTPTRIVSFGKHRRSVGNGRASLEIYPQLPWHANARNPIALGFLPTLRKADVVHCHQFNYRVTVIAILAAAIMRKPIFITDLGGYATSLSLDLGLSRFVSCFLNLTNFAESWSNFGGSSRLIYGGVDTNRFSPPSSGIKRDHFLYVGRLLPHKGIDVLIRSVGGDMPLTIVGRPYDERYYRDLLRLSEGKPVRFIIDCDDNQLLALYRSTIAVILPSVDTDIYGEYRGNAEFLGLTLLEGMACGAPAICSDVGGMPEIVEHGITGFVVPPSDPLVLRTRLRQLQEDPVLVAKMGERAVETVRSRFTWYKVAERCLAAYQDCS